MFSMQFMLVSCCLKLGLCFFNHPTYFGYFSINTTGNNHKFYFIFNDLFCFINDM